MRGLLPGGVWTGDERRHEFAFHPVTGALEQLVLERADGTGRPFEVTRILLASLASLAGSPPNKAAIRELSIGDRSFLMRQLAIHLGRDTQWLTAGCARCGERFDFQITASTLPVKVAGDGYPFATAETSLGCCRFRVPTGADEEACAALDDAVDPARLLTRLLLMEPRAIDAEALSREDLMAIEAAVEAASPEVTTRAAITCPACAVGNEVELDLDSCALRGGVDALYADVHALASHYHWSEAEILALPTQRRAQYLRMVDRARGMTQ